MKIINITNNTILAENCSTADSFFTRFLGLMGVKALPAGFGLHIIPCNSIHMFFMKIPLDIVFLDRNNVIVHLIENIKPWRITKIIPAAGSVLELPAGTIQVTGTLKGQQIELL